MNTKQTTGGQPGEHGEGNYAATRRHRRSLQRFAETHDIEREARRAEPENATVATEMAQAEKTGAARSRGEDPER